MIRTTQIISGLVQTTYQRGTEIILDGTNIEIFQPRDRMITIYPVERIQQIRVIV